jgi:hypothetical protein
MYGIFWASFCNTGKIDRYLLYKEFLSDKENSNKIEHREFDELLKEYESCERIVK